MIKITCSFCGNEISVDEPVNHSCTTEIYNPYTVPYGVIEFANSDNLMDVKVKDESNENN